MANRKGKPVITATQMLKSMVVQPLPTRAEVTDVANAVLDGTDAVMLSEETATGNYPVEAVRVMDRIIRRAETVYPYLRDHEPRNVAESIANSAARIAMDLNVDATIVFTRTGASALQLSRYRPPVPILVAAHDIKTLRKVALVWGCFPLKTVPVESGYEELVTDVVREGLRQGYLKKGGLVVITSGYPFGEPGTTNTLKVLKVE
jgi:pyruvate kinase